MWSVYGRRSRSDCRPLPSSGISECTRIVPVSVRSGTAVRAYGFAVLAFLACTLLRLALDPWLGTSVPFLLFVPAIIVAAGYGGFGPGLFVTILSAATVFVRYLEPIGKLSVKQPADLVRLALFVGSGLLIA